jgi:hypothetical protein
LLFVFISCFALTFGCTRDSWHRLPMLASASFFDSVIAAQWSIVLTAALFIPALSFFVFVKPQSGIPVLAAATRRATWGIALFGGLSLLVVSLWILPGWPREWFRFVQQANHMKAPLLTPVGVLTLAVLLRWRRPESWLIVVGAALPQTLMWYSGLMPLAIARTYREACALSLLSTLGYLLATVALIEHPHPIGPILWGIFAASVYLPAVAIVLRRPRIGEPAFFLKAIAARRLRATS